MIKKLLLICLCVAGCIILAINANPKTAIAAETTCKMALCGEVPSPVPPKYGTTIYETEEEEEICCGTVSSENWHRWHNTPSQ